MATRLLQRLLPLVLLAHGLGHGIVLVAHLLMAGSSQPSESGWQAAQSWLVPFLAPPAATGLAVILSFLALIGFVATALACWDVLVPARIWRPLAAASAVVSIVGIVLFLGAWAPPVNTLCALSANATVLLALAWAHRLRGAVVTGEGLPRSRRA